MVRQPKALRWEQAVHVWETGSCCLVNPYERLLTHHCSHLTEDEKLERWCRPRSCRSRDGAATPAGLPWSAPGKPALLWAATLFRTDHSHGHAALVQRGCPDSLRFPLGLVSSVLFCVRAAFSSLSLCSQPRSSSLPKSKGGSRKPRGNPTFILQSSRGEWDDRCGSYMWDGDGSQTCQKHRGDITFRRKIFRVKGGHLVHPSASEQSRLKRYYGEELEVNLFRETDIAECRGENLSMQKMIKNKQAQVNFNWTATKQASCSSGFAETMEMSFLATLLPCPLGFSLGSPFD